MSASTETGQNQPPALRTLFITRHSPYPPSGGAPLRNWQNINALRSLGSVGVFAILNLAWDEAEASQSPPGLALWQSFRINRRTNPISWKRKLLQWLHPDKARITETLFEPEVEQRLKDCLQSFAPDVVVFEELWLYAYLEAVQQAGCTIILDEHNVEAPLLADKKKNPQGFWDKVAANLLIKKAFQIERKFTQRADQTWVCSHEDAQLMKSLYPQAGPICVVPNGVEVDYYDPVRNNTCEPPAEHRKTPHTLLFIGGYTYTPNAIAAEWLIQDIFPKLLQIHPDAKLFLVGSSPTAKMQAAASTNIVVTGRVEDVRPYLAIASVVIVPLLDGGGTRLKILEAFAAGRPVVSTTKGAEGIMANDGEHLLIRDTVEDLVAGVDTLWQDEIQAAQIAQNALQLVKSHYSWAANAQVIAQHLEALNPQK